MQKSQTMQHMKQIQNGFQTERQDENFESMKCIIHLISDMSQEQTVNYLVLQNRGNILCLA